MRTLHFFNAAFAAVLLLGTAPVGAETPAKAGKLTSAVAYQTQEVAPKFSTDAKTAANSLTKQEEYVFSAPPRGHAAKEREVYQPVTEYLSKVTGKKFSFRYSDNWLTYSKEMTEGHYDVVFDGPAFNGWRQEKLNHSPIVKLPEDFVFVVITRTDEARINSIKDLAGHKVCAHAPPNLGTLTMLSQFDNPARQPYIMEVQGWDKAYEGLIKSSCKGTIVPITNLQKWDPERKLTKIIYKHKPMPNQAMSVGPRISTEMRKQIQEALLSEEGKVATSKLRATYAGKDFVKVNGEEYAGLGSLLKDSLYYQY